MNDLVRFSTNVSALYGKKRGRKPVFNSNMFYPHVQERELQGATTREFLRFIAEALLVAGNGLTLADDLGELSDLDPRLPDGFNEEVSKVGKSIENKALANFAEQSEMIIGKPYYPPEVKEDILKTWEANFQMLCKSAETDAKKDIAQIVQQAKSEGWNKDRLERAVKANLTDKYKSRAELIARTETAKLNSQVSLETYKSIGIEYYTWMTTIDGRERQSHAEMNGLICSVDDPDVYFDENPEDPMRPIRKERTGSMVHMHPGTDFQCRCSMVAWDPYINGKYEVKELPEEEPEEKEPSKLEQAQEETAKANERAQEAESKLRLMTAANKRHMERTPEQVTEIQARWDERNRKIRIRQIAEKRHAERNPEKILKELNKRLETRAEARALLAEMAGINGVESEKLEKAIATGNTKKIKKAMAPVEEKKKELEGLQYVKNGVEEAKKYGYNEVKSANEAIGKKIDSWSGLPQEKILKKLDFEAKWVEDHKKYATWELSQKAYLKQKEALQLKIDLQGMKSEVDSLNDYAKKSKSKILKDLVKTVNEKYAAATDISDVEELKKLVDKANKKQVELENKKINLGGVSQARRDSAFWAKDPMEYYNEFIGTTGKQWKTLTDVEKEAVYYYTHTYCPINEPLRGINYVGSETKKQLSISKIPHITNALNKSDIEKDLWLQRGDSSINVIKYRFGVDISGMNVAEARKALIGKEGIEKAFVSCGSSKGKGFSGSVITNIFVPKGTKGLYLEPISRYGNGTMHEKWDGVKKQSSVSGENETLLQRGTKFRITKVELSGSRWFIDVDVIGQEPQPY